MRNSKLYINLNVLTWLLPVYYSIFLKGLLSPKSHMHEINFITEVVYSLKGHLYSLHKSVCGGAHSYNGKLQKIDTVESHSRDPLVVGQLDSPSKCIEECYNLLPGQLEFEGLLHVLVLLC